MKKVKFLVLALAVAVMSMGAGYAAWTDTLTINNTVKTGHLDMYFDAQGAEFDADDYVQTTVSYKRDAEDKDGQNNLDIANITLSNLYPGAKAKATLKIKNNSTIPVGMQAITDNRSENWKGNFEGIGACVRFFDKDGKAIEGFEAKTTSYANPWSPQQLDGAEIPVGGYATIWFSFKASDTIDEDANYEFHVSPVFKQFNK